MASHTEGGPVSEADIARFKGWVQNVPAAPDTASSDTQPGDLREKIAAIIVRKVLQEDYDDLVEGYLDEILMAADEIILLPAYQAVAQTYYKRLSLIQAERGEP